MGRSRNLQMQFWTGLFLWMAFPVGREKLKGTDG